MVEFFFCPLERTERLAFWLVRCPSLLPSARGLVSSWRNMISNCSWNAVSYHISTFYLVWTPVSNWLDFYFFCLHPGIINLCKSGSSGIQSLIGLLCIPNMEVRVCSTEYLQVTAEIVHNSTVINRTWLQVVTQKCTRRAKCYWLFFPVSYSNFSQLWASPSSRIWRRVGSTLVVPYWRCMSSSSEICGQLVSHASDKKHVIDFVLPGW